MSKGSKWITVLYIVCVILFITDVILIGCRKIKKKFQKCVLCFFSLFFIFYKHHHVMLCHTSDSYGYAQMAMS